MYTKTCFIILLLMIVVKAHSQTIIKIDTVTDLRSLDGHLAQALIEDGDTLIHVVLRPIIIRPPYKFTSRREARRYSRLVLYVKKVYPYSIIVSKQMDEIHANLEKYKTKKEQSQYIKQKESELKKEFEGQLRKMTFTQGKILIKLIDRETGFTTFEIVKELKGSLNAFFWQSVARLFGSNLKLEYDPKGDDRMIEDIVVRIENGEL